MNKTLTVALLIVSAAALVGAPAARACDVPVFRFALERWLPDDFEVIIFTKGPLTGEAKAAAASLEARADVDRDRVNLYVTTVDVAKTVDDTVKDLWAAQKDAKLPLMVLRFPDRFRVDAKRSIWSGPVSKASVATLVDSPLRKEVTKRIIAGHSAVWILLESGDKAKDAAAEAVLKKELAVAEREFAPPPAAAPPAAGETTAPEEEVDEFGMPLPELSKLVPVKFSVVRVKRTDPAEKILVSMLTKSEPDLETKYADKTMAFPIFGRGRCLYGFVGKGINRENILEASAFLVGPCSCTVKERNPGTDLLFTADWDAAIGEEMVVDAPTPALAGLPTVGTGTVSTPRPPSALSDGPAAPLRTQPLARGSSSFMLVTLGVLAGLVVIAVVVTLVVLGRARKATRS